MKKTKMMFWLILLCLTLTISVFAEETGGLVLITDDETVSEVESEVESETEEPVQEEEISVDETALDETEWSLLIDDGDLLSAEEEAVVRNELERISSEQGMDVAVLTVLSMDGKDRVSFTDDYYDTHPYAEDGMLLMINMNTREWYLSTKGRAIQAMTDMGISLLGDEIVPYLSEGDFQGAFLRYAQIAEYDIIQEKNGTPVDVDNLPKQPHNPMWIVISLVVGLFVALIGTGSMKGKLKTVRFQNSAGNYIKDNSLNLREVRDLYLYRHVQRVRIQPQQRVGGGGSSTHISSSGSVHGGGGGHF